MRRICFIAQLQLFHPFPRALAPSQRSLGHALREQIIVAPLDDDEELTQETSQRMMTAIRDFAAVAPSITRVESSEIFPRNKWMGIVSSGMNSHEAREED